MSSRRIHLMNRRSQRSDAIATVANCPQTNKSEGSTSEKEKFASSERRDRSSSGR